MINLQDWDVLQKKPLGADMLLRVDLAGVYSLDALDEDPGILPKLRAFWLRGAGAKGAGDLGATTGPMEGVAVEAPPGNDHMTITG